MTAYIRLAEAPVLVIRAPECGTCGVETEVDVDSLTCPTCGTHWAHSDGDGDKGTMPEADETEGPALSEDEAFYEAQRRDRAARDARLRAWGITP